jgi:predicted small secreted protein
VFGKVELLYYNIFRAFYKYLQILLLCKKGVCRMVRKVLLLVVLIAVVFSFIGCQTVQGLGEDIKWTGEKGAEVVNQE